MIPALIFEFQNLFSMPTPKPLQTLRELCFRPLPAVMWQPGAKGLFLNAKKENCSFTLVSYEEEMYAKEAILSAGLCELFDEFIIIDELDKHCEDKKKLLMELLWKQYGTQPCYLYQPSELLAATSLRMFFQQTLPRFQTINL